MDIIEPITIVDSKLIYSSVAENDHAEWDSGTAYVVDDYVIVEATHRVYKCAVGNTNKPPAENIYDGEADPVTGYWVEISATNRWKMFDGKSRAATTATDEIEIELAPADFFNRVSLLNVEADQFTVSIYNSDGDLVYQETTQTIDTAGIDDFYTWFFSPITRKNNFVLSGLPAYTGARLIINASDTGETVEIGECVVGTGKFIGKAIYGYQVGIDDYSVKEADEEGNYTIEEGVYSRTGKFTVMLDREDIHDVQKTLAKYRATPLVYVGYEGQQETLIYGFYNSFGIVLSTFKIAYCDIDIEELS